MAKKVKADPAGQPFQYPLKRQFVEPDWTRLPGYKNVTKEQWESALWQRQHSAKNLKDLKDAFGPFLTDALAEEIVKDQAEKATMSLLIPPQMLNTMNEGDLKGDPVRRYMIPMISDRLSEWPNHPRASRDSLHESEMWATEGLTHRYPTKVLAEMISTCPQYCGHCTRMDLVGNSVPQVAKHKFEGQPKNRYAAMLDYLRKTPGVRDVVVSGGDVANVPIAQLESFLMELMDIPNIKDIRLATKGLQGLPQHFLQDDVLKALDRIAKRAWDRGIDIAVHTHVNHAQQVTPLVGKAV
ncbi:MAG: lysine 2,3-aminomutase, partial [Elusimicrobia bacterium]|nr:lysine 2,3-aminomutase [Elusimicrobiota bacterium]